MDYSNHALSLREWLDHLQRTDRLAVAKPGLSLRHEIAGVANRMDGRKATLFPKVGGQGGTVVSGLVSDRNWMAEALGIAPGELVSRFGKASAAPLAWKEVKSALCQEVVHREVDILQQLPVPTHNEHRSGGLLLPRHTHHYYRKAEKAGKPLEIAIAVGVDPACLLASQAIVPIDHDELEIAGALKGAPLEVAKCVTNNVRVPADAEIVLEGRILPKTRELEGPFGEFPQYYGERAERHVIEIDAITHRRDPLFHTIVGGGLEHLLLGAIPREATIMAAMRASFPGVKDVHLALGGVGRYHLYVKLDKTQEGEGKNVLLAAFAAHYDIKHAVVVDMDVDIHNPREVEWAIATRFQADRDLVVIPNSQGSKLDPSTDGGVGAKMGLDATIPVNSPEMKFKRIRVPGELEINLEAVLAPQARVKF